LAGALAPIERREDAVDHVHCADLVGKARADGHRRPVAAAGRGGNDSEALDQHVLSRPGEVRPALAIARARAVDDPRVDLSEVLVAVAHPGEDAGPEVL